MHAAQLTRGRIRRVQHSVAFYTHIGTDSQLVCRQLASYNIPFRILFQGCSVRLFRAVPFRSVKYTRPITNPSIVQLATRMATIGRIEEFREDKEEWSQYTERLEHFFAANGITDDDKKRSVFLTVIGARAYKKLRSLIAPVKPGESDFATMSKAMKDHYAPAPSEIVQRFRFNSRFRRTGESVSTYIAELRALAEFCNFGDTLKAVSMSTCTPVASEPPTDY